MKFLLFKSENYLTYVIKFSIEENDRSINCPRNEINNKTFTKANNVH